MVLMAPAAQAYMLGALWYGMLKAILGGHSCLVTRQASSPSVLVTSLESHFHSAGDGQTDTLRNGNT